MKNQSLNLARFLIEKRDNQEIEYNELSEQTKEQTVSKLRVLIGDYKKLEDCENIKQDLMTVIYASNFCRN